MASIEFKQVPILEAADITDQQRREVAERLRIEDKPALHEDQRFMNMFEDFVAEATDVWDYRETRATPEGFNAYCNILAALIDRPTCRVLRQVGNPFGICSNCGKEVFADADEPSRYCPECGAGVV